MLLDVHQNNIHPRFVYPNSPFSSSSFFQANQIILLPPPSLIVAVLNRSIDTSLSRKGVWRANRARSVVLISRRGRIKIETGNEKKEEAD